MDDKIDAMAALERQARAPAGFVSASTNPKNVAAENGDNGPVNPEEIDVDVDDL